MDAKQNIDWFEKNIAPILSGYELKFRFFDHGDFGSLSQFEFESTRFCGNIDFWGLGWLGIFVWDGVNEAEVMNILFEPSQADEMQPALQQLGKILLE